MKWCDYQTGQSGFLRLLPLPYGNMRKISAYTNQNELITKKRINHNSFFPVVYAVENIGGMGSEICIDKDKTLYNILDDETGWDRLRTMFAKNEYGEISPELQNAMQGTLLAFSLGFFGGGMISARDASTDFFRKNQHTAFDSQYDARRKLTDAMTMALLKGGVSRAVKLALFCGSYMLLTSTASTYNNKATVFEHIAVGGLCGSVWRMNLGLKGMVAGGALGSTLGLIAGSLIVTIMWLTGNTVQEMRYWEREHYKKKIKKYQEYHEKRRLKEDKVPKLLLTHDQLYKEESLKVSSELKETGVSDELKKQMLLDELSKTNVRGESTKANVIDELTKTNVPEIV